MSPVIKYINLISSLNDRGYKLSRDIKTSESQNLGFCIWHEHHKELYFCGISLAESEKCGIFKFEINWRTKEVIKLMPMTLSLGMIESVCSSIYKFDYKSCADLAGELAKMDSDL
jgi:hypothetical protein